MNSGERETVIETAIDWRARCLDALDAMRDDPAGGRCAGLYLLAQAHAAGDQTASLDGALVLAFADYYQGRHEQAEAEFERLAPQFEAVDDRRGAMLCQFGTLISLRRRGRTQEAYDLGHRCMLPALSAETTRESMLALNCMGVLAHECGHSDEAVRHFHGALDAAHSIGSPGRTAQVLANIGEVFYLSGNAEDAESMLTEAAQLAKSSNERWLTLFVATRLALSKLSLEKYDEAYAAIADHVENIESVLTADLANRAFFLSVAAYTLAMRDQLDAAENLCDSALSLLDQFEDKQLKPYSWWVRGHLHHRRSRIAQAIACLDRAVTDSDDIGHVFTPLRAIQELAEIHAEQGEWQAAYRTQQRYHALFARAQDQATRVRLQTLHINSELKDAENARRHAEQNSKAKSLFLAAMSHEIRTPLNAIIGMAHLALGTELDLRQRDYVEKIHHAGLSLLGIINSILDFSKIEAGQLDLEKIEFSLNEVLANVSTVTSANAQRKGLEYLIQTTPDIPRQLIGDPLRLGQVLINLVDNATKFTSEGEVYISCRTLQSSADRVQLQFLVCDTGIGMQPEQANKLFRPFNQADESIARKFGGTGLGLAISKRLVELMDGTIRLESQPGIGTALYFTAWFGRVPTLDQARVLPPAIHGMRVLVVDDNPVARITLAETLMALPLEIDMVGGGREALAAIRSCDAERPYALVVTDWQMPDFDGMALVEAVQRDRALKSPPRTLLLGAHSDEAMGPLFAVTPADAVLSKPLLPAALIETVIGMVAPLPRTATKPGARLVVPRFRALRVLLVEDDVINQQIARELMRAAGITADVAANGRAALERLSAAGPGHYHLILMDVQMPEMDGHELTRLIRTDQRFRELPIVAMTAHAMPADRVRCLASGMNDHVSKPINPRELYGAIQCWCPAHLEAGDAVSGAGSRTTTADRGNYGDHGDDLQIEGIDVRSGMARTMGNRALYLQMLAQFREDQRAAVSRLQQALAADDRVLAERQAHTLRGAAALVGAGAIQALGAELETAIHGGRQQPALQPLMDQLDRALQALMIELAPFTLR